MSDSIGSEVKWKKGVSMGQQLKEERERLFGKPKAPKPTNAEIDANALYTVESAAELLGVTIAAVYGWLSKGTIASGRLWFKKNGKRKKAFVRIFWGSALLRKKAEIDGQLSDAFYGVLCSSKRGGAV